MTARGRDKRDGERGQILAMMVISLLALCALVAVAADMGFFSDYRRRMQTAADAAAMAGAKQLRSDLMVETPQLASAALSGAAQNGFTNLVDGTQVIVHHPPQSGPYANNNFVEAIITQPRPTIFMSILGFQSATVSARAVAGLLGADGCIWGLEKAVGIDSVNLNGGATVDAHCPVVSDSDLSGGGGGGGGNAQLNADSIRVTGTKSGCCFSPMPTTGVPPEADPLAGRAAPSFPSTTYTRGSGCVAPSCINGDTLTLQPAVYYGGIEIKSGSNVTFSPGVYVLNGGGLKITGSTVNGTGVTFYNTATSGYPYKAVDVSGGPTGTLSAPTSGPMEAMLFFQDRTITPGGSARNNTINGGGTLALQGTLYFPTTYLTFGGNKAVTASYTILVADTITFTGGSTLNNDFSSLSSGSPFWRVRLAE